MLIRLLHLALPWLLAGAARYAATPPAARPMGPPGRRRWLVEPARRWSRWCSRWCLRRPQAAYDAGTLLLAGYAATRGHRGWRTAAVLAVGWATARWLPPRPADVAGTCVVAAAEEVIWRGRPQPVWSIAAFAALHAPAHPRSWPYHLGTGTLFRLVAMRAGLPAAIAVHAAHNLTLGLLAARGATLGTASRASSGATSGTASGAASRAASGAARHVDRPTLPPSSSW